MLERSHQQQILRAVEGGVYQGAHLAQMLGACLFHLYLHLSVARVHIVELFLAALSVVDWRLLECSHQ